MTKITLSALGACLFFTLTVKGDVTNNPDPLLLLKGVVSSREQIPPSRLWMTCTFTSATLNNENTCMAEFDGNLRRFTVPTKVTPHPEIFQFDGKEVEEYNGTVAASFSDLSYQIKNPFFWFDPRLLGLSMAMRPNNFVSDYISWADASNSAVSARRELLGSDTINGKETWHVRFTASGGNLDWWISKTDSFRVYKYMESWDGGSNVVQSFYNPSYPWLPSTTIMTIFAKGQTVSVSTDAIYKAEANVQFPSGFWTLSGMGFPTNTQISDQRTHQVLGIWDGTRIVSSSELATNKTALLQPPPKSQRRTFVIIVVLLVALSPAAWLLVVRKRN